jgi:hypothetical protein
MRAAPRKPVAPPAELPHARALVLFGALTALFVTLLGRSLYLQWLEYGFLQGQGAARFSRAIEVPAHRGRIVDRNGSALAISTPVESLWVFRDKVDATPAQLKSLAAVLETTPRDLAARLAGEGEFAFIAKQLAPETAARAMQIGIKGLNEQNEYRRYYPGGEVTAQIIGFTGDKDLGQEGIELAQQKWLGGTPGSRRVIIDRRGDIVEDVVNGSAVRALGHHHGGEKPQGPSAHHRDVVGVDVNGVPADAIGGKGDWIGGDDEPAPVHRDDCRVLAGPRANQQSGIPWSDAREHRFQVRRGELAGRQRIGAWNLTHRASVQETWLGFTYKPTRRRLARFLERGPGSVRSRPPYALFADAAAAAASASTTLTRRRNWTHDQKPPRSRRPCSRCSRHHPAGRTAGGEPISAG